MYVKPQTDDSLAESSNQVRPKYKFIALPTGQSARSVSSAYRLHLLFPCMFCCGTLNTSSQVSS